VDKLKNFLNKNSNEGTPERFSSVFNTKDSSYQVRFLVEDGKGEYTILHFRIPSEFSLDVTANWGSLVNKLINDLPSIAKQFVNSANNVAKSVSNITTLHSNRKLGNPVLSAQTYIDSSPLKLHFDFDLSAYGSAINEIIEPIKVLIALSLPHQEGTSLMGQLNIDASGEGEGMGKQIMGLADSIIGNSILVSPGPGLGTIMEANGFDNATKYFAKGTSMYIQIANYFLCGPIFIRSVKPTFTNRLDSKGLPTMAKISIDVETAYTMTSKQLSDCFLL
jgi:hypothetical protein